MTGTTHNPGLQLAFRNSRFTSQVHFSILCTCKLYVICSLQHTDKDGITAVLKAEYIAATCKTLFPNQRITFIGLIKADDQSEKCHTGITASLMTQIA